MERAERSFPATSFRMTIEDSYRRLRQMFADGHKVIVPVDEEIAFTDEFERELIRRELHPF
jgi:hypothetical protein